MSNSNDVRGWYNNFSKNQTDTGVNIRHYKIMNELKEMNIELQR